MRTLALLLSIAAFASWALPSWSASFSREYDRHIERAVDRWWPDRQVWREWKAQLYQESRLDPAAVSPVGAAGLAQFMPGTWDEVTRALGWGVVSPHIAELAIEAGAYYMARLRRSWSAPRPADDRQHLAQASYNAGLGNLMRAQRLCGGPRLYAAIVACLPAVTGRHSLETTTYVKRIKRWWQMMEAGA